MNKLLTFFLCICCFTNLSFAQNFEPGTLFLSSGTQKKGLIERTTLENTSKEIRFKSNDTATIETFIPERLSSFIYEKDQVIFESVVFDYFEQNDEKKKVQATRFAKVLVSGEVSLLKVLLLPSEYDAQAFESKAQLYLLKKEGEYTQIDRLQIKFVNGQSRASKRYKGLLTYVMNECADISKLAARTEFNDLAMIKIVKEYHNCIGKSTTVETYNANAEKAISHHVTIGGLLIKDDFLDKPFGMHVGYAASFFNPELSKRIGTTFGLDFVITQYDWNDSAIYIGPYKEQNIRLSLLLDYYLIKKKQHALKFSLGFNMYFFVNASKDVLYESSRSFLLLPIMATYTNGKYSIFINSAGQGENIARPNKIINIGLAYRFK